MELYSSTTFIISSSLTWWETRRTTEVEAIRCIKNLYAKGGRDNLILALSQKSTFSNWLHFYCLTEKYLPFEIAPA